MFSFKSRALGWLRTRDTAAAPAATAPTRLTASVYRQILGAVGGKPPENGMLLGGDPADGVVRHVVFDDGAERSGSTYSPDHVRLNRLLSDWWRPPSIRLLGFVHSHPGRFARPSGGDLHYARVILDANPHLERLLMPIVTVDPEPGCTRSSTFGRGGWGQAAEGGALDVLDEVLVTPSDKAMDVPQPAAVRATPRIVREETFQRVVGAYDLPYLRFCRVVVGRQWRRGWLRRGPRPRRRPRGRAYRPGHRLGIEPRHAAGVPPRPRPPKGRGSGRPTAGHQPGGESRRAPKALRRDPGQRD